MRLRRFIHIIMVLAAIGASAPVAAQSDNAKSETATVVGRIESESDGRIKIDIPENILQLIIGEQESKKPRGESSGQPTMKDSRGFRIQVFSDGRNQRAAAALAKARGSAIISKFPKYRGQVYTYSSAPTWYTRVGNFRTQGEATAALAELKRAFPQYAADMRIVKSQIIYIK